MRVPRRLLLLSSRPFSGLSFPSVLNLPTLLVCSDSSALVPSVPSGAAKLMVTRTNTAHVPLQGCWLHTNQTGRKQVAVRATMRIKLSNGGQG